MRVFFLYHPRSEHARKVEEFVHDFERQRGKTIDMVSLETRDGAATASLYDIIQHPALLVVRDDGQMVQMWTGGQMPLMNEVAAYTNT